MEKLTAFAEKYLEWVALAVAGVFVLLMIWMYVLTNQAAGELAGDAISPGDVDSTLLEGSAARLRSEINNPRVVNIDVADPVAIIRQAYQAKDYPEVSSAVLPNRSADINLPDLPDDVDLPEQDGGVFIAEAPVLPAAQVQLSYSGKAGVGLINVENLGQEAPVPNPEDAVDTTWVKVVYEIPLASLRQSWQDAALPNIARQTVFLDVHLLREEKLANGEWGNPQKIERLPTWFIPDEPAVGNETQEQRFRDYMSDHQGELVMEPFHEFFEGDNPRFEPVIEEKLEGEADHAGDDEFDPNDYLTGQRPGWMSDEQWEEVLQARREEAKRRQEEGRNRGGPPGEGGGGGYGEDGGYGGFGPDSGAALPIAQRQPRGRNQGEPDGAFGGEYGEYGGYGEYGEYGEFGGQPGAQGHGGPRVGDEVNGYAPRSFFNPLDDQDLDANVRGWLYDLTAQPGRVYRYKVVYAVQNPLWAFEADNVPEEKLALLDPLMLMSDAAGAEWSEPLEVEPDTYLFLAKEIRGTSTSPEFTVFRWENGTFNEDTFTASPGDPIGGMKDGIDYSTGWILADVRQDPTTQERVAVLIHADGRVQIRGRDDLSDDQVDELREQVELAAADR